MAVIDQTYHTLLEKIIKEGYTYEDPNRKGVNRIEIPSYTFRHEFKDGFPAITTKKLNYRSVATELIWFLRGDTNIKYLVDNGCNLWNKDAYNYYRKVSDNTIGEKEFKYSFEEFLYHIKNSTTDKAIAGSDYKFGNLGPVYGHQWRNFTTYEENIELFDNNYPPSYYKTGIDQIQKLITNLKEKPLTTDHIVNAWNVGDLGKMALPPCHYGFQVVVRPLTLKEIVLEYKKLGRSYKYLNLAIKNNEVSKYGFELHWNQRSVDTFLG